MIGGRAVKSLYAALAGCYGLKKPPGSGGRCLLRTGDRATGRPSLKNAAAALLQYVLDDLLVVGAIQDAGAGSGRPCFLAMRSAISLLTHMML
jgi:hypothetical protein